MTMLFGMVSNFSATTPLPPQTSINMLKNGGVRTIVQGYASFDVKQSSSQSLYINVYDSNGYQILSLHSHDLSTTVSTENWEAGQYLIKTQAKGESASQDFVLIIS